MTGMTKQPMFCHMPRLLRKALAEMEAGRDEMFNEINRRYGNMTVRAKFKVSEITRRPGFNGVKEVQVIKLAPVTGGSEENKSFYASTPSGTIELGTVNAEAAKQFDLGQEFYVDFTPVPAPEERVVEATPTA